MPHPASHALYVDTLCEVCPEGRAVGAESQSHSQGTAAMGNQARKAVFFLKQPHDCQGWGFVLAELVRIVLMLTQQSLWDGGLGCGHFSYYWSFRVQTLAPVFLTC